jgi:hypothetical protein
MRTTVAVVIFCAVAGSTSVQSQSLDLQASCAAQAKKIILAAKRAALSSML